MLKAASQHILVNTHWSRWERGNYHQISYPWDTSSKVERDSPSCKATKRIKPAAERRRGKNDSTSKSFTGFGERQN